MGTVLGVICAVIFILAWAACDTDGISDDWSEYDDPFTTSEFQNGFRRGLEDGHRDRTEEGLVTGIEAVELILTEAELLESDAAGDDDREYSFKVRRLASAMRMGAEALERSLEW